MEVLNVHERVLESTPVQVGALLDSLSSAEDRLWPRHTWPPMQFDRPLGVGATGGHGPIRYSVEEYTPGKSIRFRFTGPKRFDGFHGYEVMSTSGQSTVLRHTLRMNTRGLAILSWPLVYRPMHDALLEDSLATAQASLGVAPQIRVWSLWVKLLRWVVSGGKARRQVTPDNGFPMGIFNFGRTPASRVPDGFQFRAPWHRTDQRLHDELRRELPRQHQLYGVAARAVARRQDNDDVLLELFGSDAPADFAVVHLTWSGQPDQVPSFPDTALYPTFAQWVADCMTPDADDWDLIESTSQ